MNTLLVWIALICNILTIVFSLLAIYWNYKAQSIMKDIKKGRVKS